jgi:hypothetical protein
MHSKNLIARIRIINSCFTSKYKRYWSIDDLMETISRHDIMVSRRTIEIDLRRMRYDEILSYYAPIEYCRKNKGHYYTDSSYSIAHLVSIKDVEQIRNLVSALNEHWKAYTSNSGNIMDGHIITTDHTIKMIVTRMTKIVNMLGGSIP